MKIRVSIPSVKEIEIEAPDGWSVSRLKGEICRKMGIERAFTKLMLGGRILRGSERLGELGLDKKRLLVDYLWARHLIMWGLDGQRKIRSSAALIVGAGALGNEVAKNLAMLGVGRLTIVDLDKVELSNTSRMVFFDAGDVGKSKAEVLAGRVNRRYPFVEILAISGAVESLPLDMFLGSDVIISGLDNIPSRIFLSALSRRYGIPLIDGGMHGDQARVQVYLPPEWPCPACHLPPGKFSEYVGLKNPCDGVLADEVKIPSLPTCTSLVSSLMAQEAIKIILGREHYLKEGKWPSTGEPLKGVFIADLKFNRYSIMSLERNPGCIVCGRGGMGEDVVERIDIPLVEAKGSMGKLVELIKMRINASDVGIYRADAKPMQRVDVEEGLSRNFKPGDLLVAIAEDKNFEEYLIKLI